MVRPLLCQIAVIVVVAALGSAADARRQVCEVEPTLSVPDARTDDAPPQAQAPLALDDPDDDEECRPGYGLNPACYQDPRLPDAGRRVPLSFSQLLVLGVSSPVLPRLIARAMGNAGAVRRPSDGHARRIERPPRFRPV